METKMETKQQTSRLSVKSAGRTLKGSAHAENSEFICCINYAGPGRVRGLYGIAEGLSGDKGKTSELVIEALKKSFRHIRESDSVNGCNLLPGCLEEIHAVLLRGEKNGEESAATASLICSYIEGETAHIALAGGGAAYIIENGKISRLTEDKGSIIIADTDPSLLKPGQTPVGFSKTTFEPLFLSQQMNPDNILLFCSDGLVARIGSGTIQNIITSAESLGKAAERLVEEAHKKDDTSDVGIVLACLEPADKSKQISQSYAVHYPFSVYIWKYLILTALVIALCAIFVRGIDYTETKSDTRGRLIHTGDYSRELNPSVSETKDIVATAGLTAELRLHTEQRNANVFIDGVQQAGGPTYIITIPSEKEVELRVEAEAAEPYVEKLRLRQGDRIERIVNLRAPRPKNGSLLVLCRPQCDYMSLDGHSIEGFPKEEITLREIAPGAHRIQARLNGEREGRTLHIVSGITQSIVFRFGKEKMNQRAVTSEPRFIKPEAPRTQQEEAPEIVRTRPDTDTNNPGHARTNGATFPSNKPAEKNAFFMIDTNVPDCAIMLYRNNQLVMTGFSGTRYDIKPGKYLIDVSKIGYESVQKDVLIDRDYQVIHFEIHKQ